MSGYLNSLPDMPILGSSNSAANKDMMSKIEIRLSESVENIVGMGEIARYEQFLLFQQCFQKLSIVDEYLWSKGLTLSQTSPGFYVSAEELFWKHCGKRRNCP